MNFLQRNLFTKLRADNFGIKEEMEPMTTFKKKKIAQMLKNVNDVPAGEVKMKTFSEPTAQQDSGDERHVIDTSIETIYLLRIIVANVNGMLANGINLRGIIQLDTTENPRRQGRFRKREKWLAKLRIQRIAQLGRKRAHHLLRFSEQDEIPFVHHIERGAYKLTLRSLYYNIMDQQAIQFEQTSSGFVRTTGGTMRKNLRRSMRYLQYAPIKP